MQSAACISVVNRLQYSTGHFSIRAHDNSNVYNTAEYLDTSAAEPPW